MHFVPSIVLLNRWAVKSSPVGAAIDCAQRRERRGQPFTQRIFRQSCPSQSHRGHNELLPLPKELSIVIVKIHQVFLREIVYRLHTNQPPTMKRTSMRKPGKIMIGGENGDDVWDWRGVGSAGGG